MQLRQAKLVGPLNDDGVGAGHVDTGFNNRAGNQNIEAAVVEVAHDLFQCALGHLAVAYADAGLRHQLGQIGCVFLDGFYLVVQIVDLTPAQQLAQDCFLDHGLLLDHDKGLDRQPPRRWRGND